MGQFQKQYFIIEKLARKEFPELYDNRVLVLLVATLYRTFNNFKNVANVSRYFHLISPDRTEKKTFNFPKSWNFFREKTIIAYRTYL